MPKYTVHTKYIAHKTFKDKVKVLVDHDFVCVTFV